MFKLPGRIPTLASSVQDWADFAEYRAINSGAVPITLSKLFKAPALVSDEVDIEGIEDDSDRFLQKADDLASEIRNRSTICRGRYPFRLEDRDYRLSYYPVIPTQDSVYKYLLMSTRVNMKKERVQGGVDGALLFERLSAVVARSFFGEKAEVDVFGTSRLVEGGFRGKLESLVSRMKEGGSLHSNEGHRPQDENVDIVVWKGFSDGLPSQLIAFGQCKTGTSWSDRLSELNTEAFCKTWFTRQPVLTPVRLFFCAQYFPRDIWYPRSSEAGLVFDRFRIVDYLPSDIEEELIVDIDNWTSAALHRFGDT